MQDLAIDERMKMEDEESEDEDGTEGDESGEDEEVEEIVRAEEKILVAEENGAEGDEEEEDDEDDDEDEDSSDEDVDITPKSGFQARLERLRARTKGRPIIDMLDDDEFDEDEDDVEPSFTWGDGKDELTAQVQEFLDENAEILKGRDHKETNRIFKAIYRGDFDFDINYADMSPSKRKKEKDKDIPIELRDQWNRDRAKKADHKRAREKARLETAADPLAKKKGGKKGRKAMMAAAALDPSVEISNRVVDMASMEQQIRRFLANIGGPNSMSLPPMEKYARKTVHELATAFNLKSQSKGKDNARYTTLSKTTRSGVGINEKKINKILKKAGVVVSSASGGRQGQPPKHKPREGEIVGKAAPKIGESNVGFKMLAAMGWLEGSRIGTAGGIDVPLTAVIKNTKLGLGHK
ncbi:hypothetical protein EWM64_g4414 [Hericium alpestre]|uniref:Protein SQS1 n=1 Tax=Hericium alpestre TaxID=135208 RepID=A0A4Z0A1L4_9AGAM|nr:hypothetical protein EWM64_g4414 [Hericium alpestre]